MNVREECTSFFDWKAFTPPPPSSGVRFDQMCAPRTSLMCFSPIDDPLMAQTRSRSCSACGTNWSAYSTYIYAGGQNFPDAFNSRRAAQTTFASLPLMRASFKGAPTNACAQAESELPADVPTFVLIKLGGKDQKDQHLHFPPAHFSLRLQESRSCKLSFRCEMCMVRTQFLRTRGQFPGMCMRFFLQDLLYSWAFFP